MQTNKTALSLALVAALGSLAMGCGGEPSTAPEDVSEAVEAVAAPPVFDFLATGLADVPKLEKIKKGATIIDARKVTIPPGAVVPWHCHPGPVVFAVKSGVLTSLQTGHNGVVETEYFGPGQGLVEETDAVRSSQNDGTEDVVIYITFITPDGLPSTINLAGPSAACPDHNGNDGHNHDFHGG